MGSKLLSRYPIADDDTPVVYVFIEINIGINVYIHRNSYPGEKDFGVPINKIQESVYKVWK